MPTSAKCLRSEAPWAYCTSSVLPSASFAEESQRLTHGLSSGVSTGAPREMTSFSTGAILSTLRRISSSLVTPV